MTPPKTLLPDDDPEEAAEPVSGAEISDAELAELVRRDGVSAGDLTATEPDDPETLDWHASWCASRDGNLCDCGRPYRPGGIPHGGDDD